MPNFCVVYVDATDSTFCLRNAYDFGAEGTFIWREYCGLWCNPPRGDRITTFNASRYVMALWQ